MNNTFPSPLLMGIINLSPDSFYRPCQNLDNALYLAEQMLKEGADILDVGAEATNPQLKEIAAANIQLEIERVVPVIEALAQRFDVMISVDTSQAAVMEAAVSAGARMLNDQRALKMPGSLEMALKLKVPVCLMHGFYPVRVAGSTPSETLLAQIKKDFLAWVERYRAAGLEHIILDPGFGGGHYGKNTDENYYLLKHLDEFVNLGSPILVGWSRKSMLGDTLNGAPPEDRLYASIAAALLAAQKGAAIIRTHDVGATRDALRVWERYELY